MRVVIRPAYMAQPYLISRTAAKLTVPGHALARQGSISLQQFYGRRMLPSGGGCETLIDKLLAAARIHLKIMCLVRDNLILASMVREGLGLTIIPELALPENHDGLEAMRLRPGLRRTLHLLTRVPDALGPVAMAFTGVPQGAEPRK